MSFGIFGNLAKNRLIAFAQLVEAPPPRFVFRNRVVFHPGAASVLIEIGTGIDALIDRLQVEAALRSRSGIGVLAESDSHRCAQHEDQDREFHIDNEPV